MTNNFKTYTTFSVIAAAVLLLTTTLLFILDTQQSGRNWITHTNEVISSLLETEAQTNALEATGNLYLRTQDEIHYDDFTNKIKVAVNLADMIENLTNDNYKQTERMIAVKDLLLSLHTPFSAVRENLEFDESAYKIFENIRVLLRRALNTEYELIKIREHYMEENVTNFRLILSAGTGILLVLLFLAALFIAKTQKKG